MDFLVTWTQRHYKSLLLYSYAHYQSELIPLMFGSLCVGISVCDIFHSTSQSKRF